MAIFSGIGLIIVIGLLITHGSGTSTVSGALFGGLDNTIRTLQFQQSTTTG